MAPNVLAAVLFSFLSIIKPYDINRQIDYKQTQCLAEMIYHEARGEVEEGQIALYYVVKNRRDFSNIPVSFCDIIYEQHYSTKKQKYIHQFSYLDGGKKKITEPAAWTKAVMIAVNAQMGYYKNPIGNATMYNTTPVKSWGKVLVKLDHHYFYENKQLLVRASSKIQSAAMVAMRAEMENVLQTVCSHNAQESVGTPKPTRTVPLYKIQSPFKYDHVRCDSKEPYFSRTTKQYKLAPNVVMRI